VSCFKNIIVTQLGAFVNSKKLSYNAQNEKYKVSEEPTASLTVEKDSYSEDGGSRFRKKSCLFTKLHSNTSQKPNIQNPRLSACKQMVANRTRPDMKAGMSKIFQISC
jgi:peptidase E